MELIDKAAVVAEIERKVKSINSCPFRTAELGSEKFDEGQLNAYNEIISYIGTLEVEEVDFEKELDRIWFDNKLGNYFDNDALDFAHVRTLCKHFFELGLKAVQKGE